MNIVTKITRDNVEKAWKKFIDYMEIADQQYHLGLAMVHGMMYPLYDDLLANWDDHHAKQFMNDMNATFHNFDIK